MTKKYETYEENLLALEDEIMGEALGSAQHLDDNGPNDHDEEAYLRAMEAKADYGGGGEI